MTDISKTIEPKSDQLNSDDLLAGPRTIKVTKVALLGGDQPVAIHYEGDNGKPYKPCKSMRRVMVSVWGNDGNTYAGRSMMLYRDDKVSFGGAAVGGIRISHMSHIDKDVTLALTVTRANRKPFTVKPLRVDTVPSVTPASPELIATARENASKGSAAMTAYWKSLGQTERNSLQPILKELQDLAASATPATPARQPIEI